MKSNKSVGTDDAPANKQPTTARSRQNNNYVENGYNNRNRNSYRKDNNYSRNGYRDRRYSNQPKSRPGSAVDDTCKTAKNNIKPKPKGDQAEKQSNSNDQTAAKPFNAVPVSEGKCDVVEVNKKVEASSDNEKSSNQKAPHSHYHHKNSNKPRFAKVFTENYKEQKNKLPEKESSEKDKDVVQGVTKNEIITNHKTDVKTVPDAAENTSLINELKVLGLELNEMNQEKSEEAGELFEKLKSGEVVELDNLKQLYDKIPDITKTEIIKEEEWPERNLTTAESPTVEGVAHKTCDISCEEGTRNMICCPHTNGCMYPPHGHPPFFHPGYIPAMPHPAYYYAAMWNYHQPIPPPPVQRLATAPNLPSASDNGSVHKRFITRSTKTPGSIVFTLHTTDNLRIVSVRCEEEFTMTADLCNEEGVKVAENFDLHSPQSPKLWEQYAFSGNHSIHFNLQSTDPTSVVVTFMHEITIK